MAATAARAGPRPGAPPQSAPGPPHPAAVPPPGAPQEPAPQRSTLAPRPPPPPPSGDQGRALPSVAYLERRRLARELHDTVIQQVLAAGLTIDWCMAEVPAGSCPLKSVQGEGP